MTQRSLSVLIVLNAVLLAAIALTFGPVDKAEAQLGGGSYLMLAGNLTGSQQQAVYIMDTRSGEIRALTVNSANKRIEPIGKRNIAEDLGGNGRGR